MDRDRGRRRSQVPRISRGAGERQGARHRAVPGDLRHQRVRARSRRLLRGRRLRRAGAGSVLAHGQGRRPGLQRSRLEEGVRLFSAVQRRSGRGRHHGRGEDAACTSGSGGKIGALGFCLGGKLAYLAAARSGVDVAVGYYGVGIEGNLNEPPKCPTVLHFAEKDKFVPPEAVREDQRRASKTGTTSRSTCTRDRIMPSRAPAATTTTNLPR